MSDQTCKNVWHCIVCSITSFRIHIYIVQALTSYRFEVWTLSWSTQLELAKKRQKMWLKKRSWVLLVYLTVSRCGVCLRFCSCPLFQESGTRPNLTWPRDWLSVTENTHIQPVHPPTALKELRNRTHTLPRAEARKEVRASGHQSKPTINLPLTVVFQLG